MRLVVGAVAMAVMASAANAQTLEEKRDAKLKAPFLSKATWITDYDKAREEAKKGDKLMFAYFTRSYAKWGPCDALESGALSEEGFATWAKDYVLFCHITTQIQGEKYGKLLGEKGGRGFPYLAFLDAEGRVLAKHPPAARTVESIGGVAQKAKDLLALKKRAETDKAAATEFFFQASDVGYFTVAEARERSKGLAELTDDQKKRVDQILLTLEIQEIAGGVSWQDKKTVADAGAKFLELKKAGRIPTGEQEMQAFWICIMEHAYVQKNAGLFEEGFSALKEKFGARMNKKFQEEKEKQLAELKAEKK